MVNMARLDALKHEVFEVTPELCSERARLITESYRETRGLPAILRRALALAHILDKRTIFVRPGELFVGAISRTSRGYEWYPEYSLDIEAELDEVPKRAVDRFIVSEETKRELKEVFAYWRTHEVVQGDLYASRLRAAMPAEVLDKDILLEKRGSEGEGHLVPNFSRLMEGSLSGAIAEAERRKAALARTAAADPESEDKCLYLEATIIVCQAAIRYARRYARLLEALAAEEANPERRGELAEMARICDGLYVRPVETFWEAMQYIVLTIAIMSIESNGVSVAPGRVDQYLYPYYQRDVEAGRLTRDRAVELCAGLLINGNLYNILRPWTKQRWQTGYKGGFGNPTLGGQKPDGSDACNELTDVWLDAIPLWKGWSPFVNFRVHENINRETLLHCCEAIVQHGSQPNFICDNAAIRAHLGGGASLEEARDYAMYGCAETAIPGKSTGIGIGIWPNYGLCNWFELALNDGVDPRTGVQVGPACGDLTTYTSIEDVKAAFRRQVEYFAEIVATASNAVIPARAELNPCPFLSAFIDHRMDVCRDVTAGGPPNYNHSQVMQGHGIIDVADSLAALEVLVYREKRISAEALKRALETNYEGKEGESIRQLLIHRAPKYGNDDDLADGYAAWVWQTFFDAFQGYTNAKGGQFHPTCQTMSANVPSGEKVGALPNGRKAGEPLIDNTSPGPGLDVKGVTAVLKSVARCHRTRNSTTGAGLVNLKFHPLTLAGRENLCKFADLALCFNDLGGWQVQFNVMSSEMLRAAQESPERFRDLVVKVAGYNAQFIMLDKRLQDQIIARTEYLPETSFGGNV
jgi:pyruvate formate-lyase/glycerol dehydratase family glycyl radical enzyme